MDNYLIVGNLRQKLSYKSREAMAANWQNIFPGSYLPDDHNEIGISELFIFLESIAKPTRGRSGAITAAAKNMLAEFDKDLDEKRNLEKVDVSFSNPEKFDDPIIIPETEKVESLPKAKSMSEKIGLKGSGLEVSYYFTVGMVCYGLVSILDEIGAAAAIIYTLVSMQAIQMTKDRKARETAKGGINAVWVLSFLGFWVHLTMFNLKLWQASQSLPFQIEPGEYRIFTIACVLALLFSGTEIYSISTRLSLTTEAVEAENFEAKYNEKY